MKIGDVVEKDELLGEIVDINDPYKPRTPIKSRSNGLIMTKINQKLVIPGQIIIKVAGNQTLEWRRGNLLTSR